MQLSHTFDLPAPVDRVFDVFSRLDLLAPCFPGASVWGRDIEVYQGAVKIQFGPFPLIFEGTARVVRIDVADRRMVVKANARDRRGVAAGSARVTATFQAAGPGTTTVRALTDLDLTGRPAQLGTGVITSISDRLTAEFVRGMSAQLAAGLTAGQPAASRAVADDAAATPPPGPPTYDYSPPSETAPHLQVLPDVVRISLPRLAWGLAGLTLLVFVVRRVRRRWANGPRDAQAAMTRSRTVSGRSRSFATASSASGPATSVIA
ncbi:MAG: SRPBCC family protein [Microlunatus sp.]